MSDKFQTYQGALDDSGLMQLDQLQFDETFIAVIQRVYLWMTLGLLITSGAAYLTASTVLSQIIFSTPYLYLGLMMGELILVIVLSAAINRLNPAVATMMFFIYAVLNGMTLSAIFLVYELGSIFIAFLITACLFGSMTIIGYSTKKNLNNWGGYLFMALIGMVITSVVNIFIGSGPLDWIISFVMVFIFLGLTIYDTQRIKKMIAFSPQQGETAIISRVGLMGALSLYLDFINLFLQILRLFGRRRR